jgi:hypothetical protein
VRKVLAVLAEVEGVLVLHVRVHEVCLIVTEGGLDGPTSLIALPLN